jgi:hypothetical protein
VYPQIPAAPAAPAPAAGPPAPAGGNSHCHYTGQFAYLQAQCCRDAVAAGQTPC